MPFGHFRVVMEASWSPIRDLKATTCLLQECALLTEDCKFRNPFVLSYFFFFLSF